MGQISDTYLDPSDSDFLSSSTRTSSLSIHPEQPTMERLPYELRAQVLLQALENSPLDFFNLARTWKQFQEQGQDISRTDEYYRRMAATEFFAPTRLLHYHRQMRIKKFYAAPPIHRHGAYADFLKRLDEEGMDHATYLSVWMICGDGSLTKRLMKE